MNDWLYIQQLIQTLVNTIDQLKTQMVPKSGLILDRFMKEPDKLIPLVQKEPLLLATKVPVSEINPITLADTDKPVTPIGILIDTTTYITQMKLLISCGVGFAEILHKILLEPDTSDNSTLH